MIGWDYGYTKNQCLLTHELHYAFILSLRNMPSNPIHQGSPSSYANNSTWPNQKQILEHNQSPPSPLPCRSNTTHTPTSMIDNEDESKEFSNNEDVPLATQSIVITIGKNLK